jgi:hypothetical protein
VRRRAGGRADGTDAYFPVVTPAAGRPLLAAVAVATALAACGGAASPTPTASPKVPAGTLQQGSRLSGDSFTAGIPVGWAAKPTTTTPAGVRQTEVDSPRKDAALIIVEYPFSIFPSGEVNGSLDQFVANVVQLPTGSAEVRTVSPRVHITVAGEDAVVLAFQDVYRGKPEFTRLSVLRHAGTVYILTLGTTPALAPAYAPALDTVLSTWAWRR